MSKRNRGKALNKIPSKGRGDCPLCTRNGVKLLYDHKMTSEKIIQVCKYCRKK